MPRPYRIDPAVAHARSVAGGQARTGNDYHIRKLTEAAATLTGEQKRKLATLLMPFVTSASEGTGAAQ
jgi:hypothetical protein